MKAKPLSLESVPADTQRVRLDAIAARGWFARLLKRSEDLTKAEEVLGRVLLAGSLVAGFRITSLMINAEDPGNTMVGFMAGEGEQPFQASRIEFHRLVTRVLSTPETGSDVHPLTLPTGVDELQELLGVRYVLLADVFGLTLEELHFRRGVFCVQLREPHGLHPDDSGTKDRGDEAAVGGSQADQNLPASEVAMGKNEAAGGREKAPGEGQVRLYTLASFQARIADLLAGDLQRALRAMTPTFSEEQVSSARQAAEEGAWDRVHSALRGWPQRIATCLRVGMLHTISNADSVAEGLLLEAKALRVQGQLSEAEEAVRLLLQWQPQGSCSGAAFAELGRLFLARQQYGQAIGMLRRARSVGSEDPGLLVDLAKCFVQTGRFVAAACCCDEAKQAGVPELHWRASMDAANKALGKAWPVMSA